MMIAYKFRIYPTRKQEVQLEHTLNICRDLYNLALLDRKNTYEMEGISRSYEDQSKMLTLEKKNGNFDGIYSSVLQDVLRRLDKSFKAFFRRVKNGENPGYPRFKGEGRYKSFTYPNSGFKIEGSKLVLSKIGSVRIFMHRDGKGVVKTCTIKRDQLNRWFAILVTETENPSPVNIKNTIGVDMGLKNLITTSSGEIITYPKYYIQYEKKLTATQRDFSRKKKGSVNQKKARLKIAKIHNKILSLRNEFHHQLSKKLVSSFDLIIFENLDISSMLNNHQLAKHIQDHAWGKLIQFTKYKAENAGKIVEFVNARYTSQKCSQCGIIVPKTLADRIHSCPNCGLEMDRDLNAALNIRTLGLRGRAYRDAVGSDL